MGNFVRGGQLFLHALRMFHQVIKPVALWSLAFWLIITVLLSYKRLNYIQVGSFLAWLEASVWNLLLMNDIDIAIPIAYGEIIRKSGDVPNIPMIIDNINYSLQVVEVSAMVSLGLTIVVAITIGWYLSGSGKDKTSTNVLRGSRLGEFKKVRKKILTNNIASQYNSYTAADMFYPFKGEMKHSIIIGTTGAGKTVLISDIVEQIRTRGDKAIIFDTKKCYIEWFYDPTKDYILNPYDERSEKWNILKEISHSGQIKSIIEAFIPNSYGQDKVWNESARVVASTVLEKLKMEQPHLSNREVADVLLKQDIKSMAKLLEGTYAQSTLDPNAAETAGGVLFNLSTYLNGLRLIDGTQDNSFSIREWVINDKKEDSLLFISSRADSESEAKSLQTAWWEVAFKSLLSRERDSDKKIWIILDELASLQQIPSLVDAMSKTREYGGCFVLGFQSISQIEQIYGKDSKTLSSLCNARCIFKTPDPDTAKWVSQNIGDQELEHVREGLSYGAHQMRDGVSVNKQAMTKSLVLPSEIQNLQYLELYIQMSGHPFVKTKIKWKGRRTINQGLIEPNTIRTSEENTKEEFPKKETKTKEQKKINKVKIAPKKSDEI